MLAVDIKLTIVSSVVLDGLFLPRLLCTQVLTKTIHLRSCHFGPYQRLSHNRLLAFAVLQPIFGTSAASTLRYSLSLPMRLTPLGIPIGSASSSTPATPRPRPRTEARSQAHGSRCCKPSKQPAAWAPILRCNPVPAASNSRLG